MCLNSASSFSPDISKGGRFTRKQRGAYSRLRSYISRVCGLGLGESLKAVTLTTGPKGGQDKLRRHHNELVRRAERIYQCRIIYFVVETDENRCPGVLHILWAVESLRGIKRQFIPVEWIRAEWLKIHGAFEVYVKSVWRRGGRIDAHGVASYYVAQYYSGQSRYVRSSYSRKKLGLALAKTWRSFKRECRRYIPVNDEWHHFWGLNEGRSKTRQEMYHAWNELLERGSAFFGDTFFSLEDGGVMISF